jgi:hypothetical protein
MITEKDLDEMDLPNANLYEELETLSEQNLQPLFQPSQFELCTRDRRDKGIDLTYEIKRNNKHLGFRFIIQLKATESIKANKDDGSFSKSIDTSNINALLNNGHTAFYLFYDANTKTFYYEHLTDFLKYLNEKDKDWGKQGSHILRFKKKLLPDGISLIYDAALKNGLLQRNLLERATYISTSINKSDRVSIDSDFNLTDDTKIRELIEHLGFELINEGKWREILSFHQMATGKVANTALYNLILGIANYYVGSRWDALSFLKKANNLKSELNEEMQMHLSFFDLTVRYSSELISEEEYEKRMAKIENSETVGLYIKLDNAKRKYIESLNKNSEERFDLYVKAIEEIINNPKANKGLILTAKCELILFQGYFNNHEYVRGIAQINVSDELIGVDPNSRIESARSFITTNEAWHKSVEALIEEAGKQKNSFAYFTAQTNKAKVIYQFMVYMANVKVQKEIPGYPVLQRPNPNNIPMLERTLKDIGEAANFFSSIGHIENTIAATSTMYEILHYLKRMDEANKIMTELETLIDKFDLKDHKQRLEYLKNGGTTHETFNNWIEQIFTNADNIRKEIDKMREEMIKMDEEEKNIEGKSYIGNLQINLFPIGYFQFPKEKTELVYEIIQVINPEMKKRFDEMFKMVIPIANILHNPIEIEGPQDGIIANRRIENWRNIYRIRKAFYENKFYRFDIK